MAGTADGVTVHAERGLKLHGTRGRIDRRSASISRLELQRLCHDLQQPVAAILAVAEAAAQDPSASPMQMHWLRMLTGEADRLAAMVSGIMANSDGVTVDAGPTDTDAGELLHAIARSWSITSAASISVRPGPAVRVAANPIRLRRALDNLVANAVRAADRGGCVLLSVAVDGEWVHLDVEDDGPGFGQGPVGSAGLGITIAEGVARECGGALRIGPREPSGVRARLILPAPAARPTPP